MRTLQLAVPPPVIGMLTALFMWLLSALIPGASMATAYNTAAALAFAAAGLAVSFAGVVAVKRAGTTIDPRRPGSTSVLVTSGVYRFTRNPMYLGMLLVLLAWGLALGNGLSLLSAFAFVTYINRYQIRPEERLLQEKFGTVFAAYAARVRRWI